MEDYKQVAQGILSKLAYCGPEGFTVRINKLQKGATVPEHSHKSWQAVIILEGQLLVKTRDGERLLTKNDILIIPPCQQHSAQALEDTVTADINWPLTQEDEQAAESLAGPGACQ